MTNWLSLTKPVKNQGNKCDRVIIINVMLTLSTVVLCTVDKLYLFRGTETVANVIFPVGLSWANRFSSGA